MSILQLRITVVGSADANESAISLIEALDEVPGIRPVPAQSAEPRKASQAQATKSVVFSDLGAIIVALSSAGALLPTIVSVARDWLLRQAPETKLRVKDGDFEFEWSGTTPSDDVMAMVAKIVDRHD